MAEREEDTSVKLLRGAPDTASRIKEAAVEFVDALTPSQRSSAVLDFKDDERLFWHYTPIERRGVPLRDMNEHQRPLAYSLLASGLAQKAFLQAQAIIDHEMILGALERAEDTVRFDRDPGLYFFTLFGDPSNMVPWSCRVEGHHLSLHFTIVDGELLAVTPSFFGANPARVLRGPKKGLRILAAREDLARDLALSLDRQQMSRVLISDVAPKDIITTNSRQVVLDKMDGLPAASMSNAQRQTLMQLVKEYIEQKPPEVSEEKLHKLESRGVDSLHFAWAGGLEPGQPHYYRIQGTDFLVEYDNVQDDANHIHSVWRDPENDFGVDLLRLHHEQHHAE